MDRFEEDIQGLAGELKRHTARRAMKRHGRI